MADTSTGKMLSDALFFIIILMIGLAACAWIVVYLYTVDPPHGLRRASRTDKFNIIIPMSIALSVGILMAIAIFSHLFFKKG